MSDISLSGEEKAVGFYCSMPV